MSAQVPTAVERLKTWVRRRTRGTGLYPLTLDLYRFVFGRNHLRRIDTLSRFYRQFVGRGELVFDIGANVGNWTEAFLRLGARVVAVEPQPECGLELRARFGRSPGFQYVEAGLAATPGVATMFVATTNTMSTISPAWKEAVGQEPHLCQAQFDREISVRLTTLDDLIREFGQPSFCKIDVEGFEFQVLNGLSCMPPCISFEASPWNADAAVECVRRAARVGAKVFNYSRAEVFSLALVEWVDLQQFIVVLGREFQEHPHDQVDVYAGTSPPSSGT